MTRTPPPSDGPPRRAISTGPPRLTAFREQQLVATYLKGGPDAQAALSELLHAYQRRMFAVCARMLRNEEDARDATQESVLKVIEGLEGYDARAKLSTWIIRVTINCCLSHIRRQRIRRHLSLDSPQTPPGTPGNRVGSGSESTPVDLPGRELSAVQRIELEEQRSRVLAALHALDPQARALLVLRDTQDLEYEELCEVFEVPLGTIKSRLFRAREALRAAVERAAGDDPASRGTVV